ncbi:DUF550 domain-containing protein [Enterobacter ludwigii]
MTNNNLTDERIEAIAFGSVRQSQEEGMWMARELQAYRKAAGEPVYQYRSTGLGDFEECDRRVYEHFSKCSDYDTRILYTAPQSAPEREQVRRDHAKWSLSTFGDVGPVGPLKHLSREALEAAANPCDPFEWADMQFLLWNAQMRMGISDEFITWAMVEKLAINKARQWPEPKDGEPCLHIKEVPIPVVPDGYVMVPAKASIIMIRAGAKAAREYLEEYGGNSPQVIYQAMIAAASLQEE